jgi:hypothetical protein
MLDPERFSGGISEAVPGRSAADPAARPAARMGHLGPTGVHLKVVRERLGQRTLVSCLTPTPPYCGMHEDVAEQVAAMFRTPVSNPLAETTWGAADERSDQRSHCVRGGTCTLTTCLDLAAA